MRGPIRLPQHMDHDRWEKCDLSVYPSYSEGTWNLIYNSFDDSVDGNLLIWSILSIPPMTY